MPSEKERMAAFVCGDCDAPRPSGHERPSNPIQVLTCEGRCGRLTKHTYIGIRVFEREFDEHRRNSTDHPIRVHVRYRLLESQ